MLADTDVPSVSSAQLVRAREPNDLSFMLYISIFIYMDTFNKFSNHSFESFSVQFTTAGEAPSVAGYRKQSQRQPPARCAQALVV
ncbi:hypothetical protein S7S_12850 [Isoalcanivorax pacificus W11-5]|uniref:Uncharacterized protein n=1 Tax=Isoalcanivorax pacificus W11-5 TaxID=391936 RepID=A0A0B4XRY3_9GAMM|nr:hypothetical protein S7S_12850 [Isoalcanivorax pacificus W11-5]